MRIILPEILSLIQYNHMLESNSEQFKPSQCLTCGKSGLWNHGHYERKADFDNPCSESLNPIFILRFYCPCCQKTCSVLPECIPPERQYPWLIQQTALMLLLAGFSARAVSLKTRPSRWTISRWLKRLTSQFMEHASHLRSIEPSLGRLIGFTDFWCSLLKNNPLSRVMFRLNNAGVVIP